MQNLQFLIDALMRGRRFHISILDLSGILDTPLTKLKFKNVVHMTGFCNIAKSTSRGYRVCQLCKGLTVKRAISEGEPFGGHCFQGLYEVLHPIKLGDTVAAVVYVGGAVIDGEESLRRIKTVTAYSGVNAEKLCKELKDCETGTSPSELFRIADLVADYLVRLYNRAPRKMGKVKKKTHWLVKLMQHHADEMFRTEITVAELAETYGRNEKYMGRLFKEYTGMTFNEYKQRKRLERAEEMLLGTDWRIIDIALECGFNSISYFNRSFLKHFGTSPSAYRRRKE